MKKKWNNTTLLNQNRLTTRMTYEITIQNCLKTIKNHASIKLDCSRSKSSKTSTNPLSGFFRLCPPPNLVAAYYLHPQTHEP